MEVCRWASFLFLNLFLHSILSDGCTSTTTTTLRSLLLLIIGYSLWWFWRLLRLNLLVVEGRDLRGIGGGTAVCFRSGSDGCSFVKSTHRFIVVDFEFALHFLFHQHDIPRLVFLLCALFLDLPCTFPIHACSTSFR